DRRNARSPRAGGRRRAPALLPDHDGGWRRGARGSAAPGAARADGARQRLRAGESMMRAYNLLLRLYPASFRNEYGEEMRLLFARRRRDVTGPGSVLLLYLQTIAEILGNAVLVHLDLLGQDLRYTARMLRRAPGFAITAVLIVALGIGATTAAFSVTDFVLLRPLPFPDPDRLVQIWETTPGYDWMEFSAPNYRDWKAAAKSYEAMGMYYGDHLTMI